MNDVISNFIKNLTLSFIAPVLWFIAGLLVIFIVLVITACVFILGIGFLILLIIGSWIGYILKAFRLV